MARYLLDTNVVIQIRRGRSDSILEKMKQISPEDMALCTIVWAELLVGVRLSPAGYERERKKLEPFLRFSMLPFDRDASEHYAEILAHLQSGGQLIGERDLQIAGISRSRGMVLITHNTREF